MKKILLIFLILNISIKSVLGQCGEGFIELKQQGKWDWVQTYSKLSNEYKSKKELKSFFYDEKNKPKNCISFKDLQSLNTQIQKVFANTKSDKAVNEFKVAIKVAAEANNPDNKTGTTVKPEVSKATTSTTKSEPTPKTETDSNALIDSLKEKINMLEGEKTSLQNDNQLLKSGQNRWTWLLLGLLVLSMGLIGWLIWDSRNKMREKEDEFRNLMKSQSENYDRKIKEIEARSQAVKNPSRDAIPETEPKIITDKVPEHPKPNVPELPKPQEKLKQFYLSSPALSADGKGIFDGSEMYNANSINALYVFNLLNDTSAEFKFFNIPTTVKDAIILPDRYLLPACEYSGVNSNATKIITTKAGKAVKDGNNWKITQKAEIRFE